MSLRPKFLKSEAKSSMAQASPHPMLTTLIYLLATTVGVNLIYEFVPALSSGDQASLALIPLFLTVVLTLYQTIMSFGYSCWALNVARDDDQGPSCLLDGFGMVGRVLMMELRILLGVTGRVLLISVSYSLVIYSLMALSSGGLVLLLTVLASVIYSLGVLCITLRYSLSHYFLCDAPEMGSLWAVHRSTELMSRHIWDLVKVHLSFWPWYVLETILYLIALAVVTGFALPAAHGYSLETIYLAVSAAASSLAVALAAVPVQLFLMPYQNVTQAKFYLELVQQAQAQPEMPPL